MDGEAVHGTALGVNWFWAVVVCGYHVVWSVLIPIAVVHLALPGSNRSPWLSRRSTGTLVLLFVCGAAVFLAISLLRSDFRLPVGHAAATVAVVASLVSASVACRKHGGVAHSGRVPGRMTVGLFGSACGIGWFILFLASFIGGPVSFVWWTVGALAYAAAAALVVQRWTRRAWTPRHQLALCFGAAMASALFGLLLVAVDGHPANIAFQCAVTAALVTGYLRMDRHQNHASADDQQQVRSAERQERS